MASDLSSKVLFLFSCLLFISVRVIIAPPVGEDVQPLCQGAYHPVSGGYLAFTCLVRGRRTVFAIGIIFFLQPVREDVWFTHFSGGYVSFIETCSCVRRQVLVPNAKRWETGSWEVARYLPAHVCSWLWTYHPEGRVDVVYLLAWVLGVVGHFSWWPYSTLVSQTLIVFRLLRVYSGWSSRPYLLARVLRVVGHSF